MGQVCLNWKDFGQKKKRNFGAVFFNVPQPNNKYNYYTCNLPACVSIFLTKSRQSLAVQKKDMYHVYIDSHCVFYN